jgi:hypothetical protein
VPDRDDTALRAAADGIAGLDAQNQAGPGCRDGADVDAFDAFDTKQRIRPLAPATTWAGSSIGHIRVFLNLEAWSLLTGSPKVGAIIKRWF